MRHARRLRRIGPLHNGDRRDGDDLCLVGQMAPLGLLRRGDRRGCVVCADKAAPPQVHGCRDRGAHRTQPPRTRGASFHRRRARAGWRPVVVLPSHGGDYEGRRQGRADGFAQEGVYGKDREAEVYRRRDRRRHTPPPVRGVSRRHAQACDARTRSVRRG